jgi:hypothetical protein
MIGLSESPSVTNALHMQHTPISADVIDLDSFIISLHRHRCLFRASGVDDEMSMFGPHFVLPCHAVHIVCS